MKNRLTCILVVFLALLLSGCDHGNLPSEPTFFEETEQVVSSEPESSETEAPETEISETETSETESVETQPVETETTATEVTETIATEPMHSPMYIPGVAVEDVILYFNEVCLDSEFVNSGDPSFIQKWTEPLYYTLEGPCTDSDIATINAFTNWLNSVDGFPGIFPTEDPAKRNLRICFSDRQGMLSLMGPNFENMDGAVTFWYMDNSIYNAIICVLSNLDQPLRNSVILEEIYNGLGPIQDTVLRPDSIIYQEFSQNQWLSPMDELILRLLYHPDIQPGMNAQECEQIIRGIYY